LFLSVAAANSHQLLTEVFRWVDRLGSTVDLGQDVIGRVSAAIAANSFGKGFPFDRWIGIADLGVDSLVTHMRTALVDVALCDVKGVGCDPLTVVRRAEQKWAEDKRRNGVETYDQVWCVVDHDDHATLDAAIARASKVGIELVVSTPCFDYWVLLHYVDHRKSSSVKDIERKLDKHIPGYDKKLPDSFPFDRYSDAVRRAVGAAPSSNAIGRIRPQRCIWS
jgi:hypothetical protein